ncbi:hypothetical protein CALVIDRAFT_537569 [Calocera viscosa TUFC12733]|uniref:WHIM2 domain-containing protein n=1 Tax=Calocera viscosa (strain TUFC12733) TaxID=1330018 RepID=A0A167LSF8_CALVF|nr:hypothetical protein CALVIDRAFT_537569 [Calocera viscosa TUFC12733]
MNERKMECLWYDMRSKVLRNPLEEAGDDVFAAPWALKLDILRQLVDWALATDAVVRERIRAARDATKWSKPKEGEVVDVGDTIVIEPIGLDLDRRRYWVLDYSGRLYRSGNPWKNVCPFITITSSNTELNAEVERMEGELAKLDKERAAKPRSHPVTKWENSMRAMVKRLREEVLPRVEQEEIVSSVFRGCSEPVALLGLRSGTFGAFACVCVRISRRRPRLVHALAGWSLP